ncbi:unnamed protein product [Bemisia tabaci]|uniref:Galectin n=1 Tax=Bemisia tabaci TaxID=7038 RepID=A0A9P0AMQ1_BEMTA|nr:unnamed protein product [Bemisia tabaci]
MYATTLPLLLLGFVLALKTSVATNQVLQLATPGGGNKTQPDCKPSTEHFQTEKMYFQGDPCLPLVIKLHKGFLPGTKALIEATTRREYSWFAVELRSSTSGDIFLQIHGRPYDKKIVKNSKRMGESWGKEEVEERVSFLPSDQIKVAIVCLRAAINITINGHPVGGFSHRLSPSIIDELRISGGLWTRLVAYTTPITQAILQTDGREAVGDSFPGLRPLQTQAILQTDGREAVGDSLPGLRPLESSSTDSQVTDDFKFIHQVFESVKDDATRIQLITTQMAEQAKVIKKKEGDIKELHKDIRELQGNIEKLQEEKEHYQEELSLILAMGIIEWLENAYSKGFNETGDVTRGQNLRKAKWTFMLKNRRDETAIKEMLDKIHAEDKSYDEEKLVNNIIEIEKIVLGQEKRFVEGVTKAGSYLNQEKHRIKLRRNPIMLVIFTDTVPAHIVKTVNLLKEVYVNEKIRRVSGED